MRQRVGRQLAAVLDVKIEPGHVECPLCGHTFWQPYTQMDLEKRVRRDVQRVGGQVELSRLIGVSATALGRAMKGAGVAVDTWFRIARYYQTTEHQHAPMRVDVRPGQMVGVGFARAR